MTTRVRVRHHVNPLGSEFQRRKVGRIIVGDESIEMELGCADARFLFERAPHHPETRFVGVEIREPLVGWVNRTAQELGVPNVEAHFGHAYHHLDSLFADERLDRIFVNFPDPWFKRRHEKRRLMSTELLKILHRKLKPGGFLFFQSDVYELALDALFVLEQAPEWFSNLQGPWSFTRENPYDAKSLREVKCERRGDRIWRLHYLRSSP